VPVELARGGIFVSRGIGTGNEMALTAMSLSSLILPRATALIVAAGRGQRFGVPSKVLQPVAGRPLLAHAIDAAEAATTIVDIVLVVGAHTRPGIAALLAGGPWLKSITVVDGGARRHDSVAAGLAAVSPASEYVAIHDGARPFAPPSLFDACVIAAARHGAAIAAIPVSDTLKRVEDELIAATVDRAGLWAAQTPQVFRRSALAEAMATPHDPSITDEARLFEDQGRPVAIVPGAPTNIKVTHPGDLLLAESIAATRAPTPVAALRTGIGYDAHVFAPDRRLVLGGVVIPHTAGLLGHSDADVLLHAIADALLGAAALGDIGQHFPPSDPAFKDADSQDLLHQVARLLRSAGYAPANVDATVIAEAPRLGPHVPAMRAAIAACLDLPETAVSVKATTNEGMGAIGRGEGIAALATATISAGSAGPPAGPPADRTGNEPARPKGA
jgi:2-C-methyl-D-erythritol 4-phosphate cytidylyltransferase/2-C-methyl-D-erythritol 2,4-cyclodiphosphate synthase